MFAGQPVSVSVGAVVVYTDSQGQSVVVVGAAVVGNCCDGFVVRR